MSIVALSLIAAGSAKIPNKTSPLFNCAWHSRMTAHHPPGNSAVTRGVVSVVALNVVFCLVRQHSYGMLAATMMRCGF